MNHKAYNTYETIATREKSGKSERKFRKANRDENETYREQMKLTCIVQASVLRHSMHIDKTIGIKFILARRNSV